MAVGVLAGEFAALGLSYVEPKGTYKEVDR